MKVKNIIAALAVLLLLTGCRTAEESASTESPQEPEQIRIGMSFDTFVLERWIRDRDIFVSTATELGATVNVQNANGNPADQASQINYLIDKGMDVLVIIAVDGTDTALQEAIDRAQSKGIKIIAYDRSIPNAGVDLYASFDSEEVGVLMAEAVLSQMPEDGRIAILYGSPSDYNVVLLEQGVSKVLAEHDIEPVYKNYADNWKAEYAYDYMNECLDDLGPVEAVICGNDGLASMAVKSLSEHRMAGDVCVVGQDADIDACQRIVEGTQYMTVFKSIDQLAKQTAQYAVRLADDEPMDLSETFYDGSGDVPFLKLTPIAVTKETMDREIIDSGFHLKSEVYLNVDSTAD